MASDSLVVTIANSGPQNTDDARTLSSVEASFVIALYCGVDCEINSENYLFQL